jgi:hypothetical protein
MSAAITALLSLIGQLLPLVGSWTGSGAVASIITTLTQILPLVVQEVETVGPAIKNIIDALSANPATTAEELAQLQALDAQVDAAFESAAAATDAGT